MISCKLQEVLDDVACWFPWAALLLLLLFLALPIVTFLIRGLSRRRQSILDAFDENAAREYLRHFHASQLHGRPAKESLKEYYNSQFGRRIILAPAVLLLAVAAVLLIPCALCLATWLTRHELNGGPFPLVVVLAIAGGYMWVLFDLIYKVFSELLLPRDLCWDGFRLIICVPAGFAIGYALPTDTQLPLAFCLGALPTRSIFTILRRTATKAGVIQANEQGVETEIQVLPGVDLQKAEVLADEGITAINQLANSDPVRLTIRTGLPFGYVVGIIGDAILWSYIETKDRASAFRLCGVNGAYDCRLLLYDLWESTRPNDRQDAAAIVAYLASKLQIPEAGVLNLLWNVAHDPTAEGIYLIWG